MKNGVKGAEDELAGLESDPGKERRLQKVKSKGLELRQPAVRLELLSVKYPSGEQSCW